MTQLQFPITEGVAAKLDRILARVGDKVVRGTDVTFIAQAHREANRKSQVATVTTSIRSHQ